MNAACVIMLSVMPVTGGVPEMVKVPTQRDLITRVEPYREHVAVARGTINARVYFRKLSGHPAPTPVYVFETPAQIKRLPCRRIQGE